MLGKPKRSVRHTGNPTFYESLGMLKTNPRIFHKIVVYFRQSRFSFALLRTGKAWLLVAMIGIV